MIRESKTTHTHTNAIQSDDVNNPKEESLNIPYKDIDIKAVFERKITIIGSQQCVGLSSRLIHSRQNSRYNKYQVSSIIKPNAASEEILKTCYQLECNENNYVILCVGENDSNPTQLIFELAAAIKRMRSLNILLINIENNIYLNTIKLNNELKILCQNMDNCNFIEISNRNINRKYYLNDLCDNINRFIDYNDYSKTFLKSKKVRTCLKPVHKRGTIPFYFMKMESSKKLSKTSDLPSGARSTESRGTIKKGTIPYYFKKITNKNINDEMKNEHEQVNAISNNNDPFRGFKQRGQI